MAMDPGTVTNNLNLTAAPQRLLIFCPLQMSISILASNSNTYTLHRYFPHIHTVLVYFWPLERLPITWYTAFSQCHRLYGLIPGSTYRSSEDDLIQALVPSIQL
jgi:hypothetical protein